MTTYIAVITARTQTLRCQEIFRTNGIACKIVNTPKEAGVGCGISLEFACEYFFRAKQLITQCKIDTLHAFYRCERTGTRRYLVRV